MYVCMGGKNIVCIGFSTIHCFRHPLAVLGHIPQIRRDDCTKNENHIYIKLSDSVTLIVKQEKQIHIHGVQLWEHSYLYKFFFQYMKIIDNHNTYKQSITAHCSLEVRGYREDQLWKA